MTPSQAASGGPAPAPVSEQDLDDFIEGFYPDSTSYRMAAELKRIRALLREAKPALQMAQLSLTEDARRWVGHNGQPDGFAKECRDDAAMLSKLIEACP